MDMSYLVLSYCLSGRIIEFLKGFSQGVLCPPVFCCVLRYSYMLQTLVIILMVLQLSEMFCQTYTSHPTVYIFDQPLLFWYFCFRTKMYDLLVQGTSRQINSIKNWPRTAYRVTPFSIHMGWCLMI